MNKRPTFLALYIDKKTGKIIQQLELKEEEIKFLIQRNGKEFEADGVIRIIVRNETILTFKN